MLCRITSLSLNPEFTRLFSRGKLHFPSKKTLYFCHATYELFRSSSARYENRLVRIFLALMNSTFFAPSDPEKIVRRLTISFHERTGHPRYHAICSLHQSNYETSSRKIIKFALWSWPISFSALCRWSLYCLAFYSFCEIVIPKYISVLVTLLR